jgi:hypothetical protein
MFRKNPGGLVMHTHFGDGNRMILRTEHASSLLTSIVAGISLSPLISLIAGILILIMPRLLNFIVAIYLIIIGLVGVFHL